MTKNTLAAALATCLVVWLLLIVVGAAWLIHHHWLIAILSLATLGVVVMFRLAWNVCSEVARKILEVERQKGQGE